MLLVMVRVQDGNMGCGCLVPEWRSEFRIGRKFSRQLFVTAIWARSKIIGGIPSWCVQDAELFSLYALTPRNL